MDIPKECIKADLIYKNTPERDLMLTFLPPIKQKYEKAPVYFIISGGGWHMMKRQDIIDFSIQSVEALRNRGFAVVSIDYRVCGEGVAMREIITDCFDAARYIAHFAQILEIDKEKFVLSGHSAGGHLALMLSYASQEIFKSDYEFSDVFKVISVAPMSPPIFLDDNSTHGLGDIVDVFDEADMEEEMKSTSPATYVSKDCPPTLLMAGTSDRLVYANSSEKLYKLLKDNDVDCELILSVGGGHCFEQMHETITPGVSMEQMQNYIIDFILKQVGGYKK